MSVPPSSPGASGTGQGPVRRRRRWWLAALVIPALVVAFLPIWVFWPVPVPPLQIARDTTYLTGPLNPDGTVNYVAAVNAMYSEGVTPENNAAILILQALGPAGLGHENTPEAARQMVYAALGMEPPSAGSECFISLKEYLKELQPQETDRAREEKAEALSIVDGRIKEADRELVRGWLARNKAAVELLKRAAQRERFFVPWVSPSDPPRVIDYVPIMAHPLYSAGQSLGWRAMLRAQEGDLAGAWEDSLAVRRLARLCTQSPGLIVNMVGVGIDSAASRVNCWVLEHADLSAGEAQRILQDLQAAPELPLLHQSVNIQRFIVLDTVMQIARAMSIGKASRNSLDINVMLRYLNGWHDRRTKPFGLADYCKRYRLTEAFQREFEQHNARMQWQMTLAGRIWTMAQGPRRRQAIRSQQAAHWMLMFTMANLSVTDTRRTQSQMERDLVEVGLALAAWRAEKGAYPVALADLSPEYLAVIPQDLFTGQPLRYVPGDGGYLLYSVGPNGQDDGGKPKTDEAGDDADDIVIRVGAAAQPEAGSQQPEEARTAP